MNEVLASIALMLVVALISVGLWWRWFDNKLKGEVKVKVKNK